MKGFFSEKKKAILARAIVLGLCLGFFSHVRAAVPSDFETEEYFKSTGLDIINASSAYSKGYTGRGITVGISDTPIIFTSPEFDAKQHSYQADDYGRTYIAADGTVYYLTEDSTDFPLNDPEFSYYWNHGAHEGGIVAACRNGQGMHGVAYEGELVGSCPFSTVSGISGTTAARPGWADAFLNNPAIKIVNCSWNFPCYPLDMLEENDTIQDFMDRYWKGTDEYKPVKDINSPLGKNKLFVWSAGNHGFPMPALGYGFAHWDEGRAVATNSINVTALEDTKYLTKEEGRIRGFNILGYYSNGASFNEDGTLAAPGTNIVSASADYARDKEMDTTMSGTSMAAPHAAGAAVLVQQAFPYMTGKQIGDVLLSTANPNVVSQNGCTVTLQFDYEGYIINVYYGDGAPRTLAQQKLDCYNGLLNPLAEYDFTPEVVQWCVDYYPIHDYYNVPMEALIGQGILYAGKAVDGPGALNARRLEKSDISSDYTVKGKPASQALYAVDTVGYDSVWANDIKEVRVGLLAADSTEEDLRKRYNYYKTNWLDRTRHGSGDEVVGKEFVNAYIKFFNEDAANSGLINLPVGLLKMGEGRLSLTGNNTYNGASIAKQGTLSIDGSVAGDAYSIEKGTISGRGTIYGTLYNNNIAVAGDAAGSGNLTMDKLVSRGVLLSQYQNGTNTQFIVKGEADINGSTVPIPLGATPMPDDKYTVVKAGSIAGQTRDLSGTEYELSGMLSAKNEIEGGNLSVVVEAANNMDGADAVQNETFDAMTAMYRNLKRNNDPRMNDMQPLFSLSSAAAKEALSAISSNASAQSMAVAQRSMMTHHILSSRLNEAFMPKPVEVKLPTVSLMDGDESNAANAATQNGLQQNVTEQQEVEQYAANDKATQRQNENTEDGLGVSLKLLEPAKNDIWLKFGKNWGDLKDGADYHSSTTMLGYDKAVAPHWRAGAFAGYSSTGFADSTASNELKDTRFGLYAGYNKAGKEGLVYLDYGWMRNKLRRGLTNLGLTANAKYHSRILELGGEYLYDLHAGKNVPWHVRPYVNAQLSRLWQNGYSEEGAGVYNQVVDSKRNDYFGMGAGVEFKRYLPGGNYAVRAGVRHAFAGAEPKLRYSYMGDAANTYDMRNVQDKTHFVLSVGGETQIAKGWSIGGDASFTRGRHDKDFSCNVTVKRMW
ncbi:MAG: autotransporter domain-containing protein [Acidaminococcaceae bacterium]|nr:autotransporter domain-containing protein [Acidaminococcaceae bacterium]